MQTYGYQVLAPLILSNCRSQECTSWFIDAQSCMRCCSNLALPMYLVQALTNTCALQGDVVDYKLTTDFAHSITKHPILIG